MRVALKAVVSLIVLGPALAGSVQERPADADCLTLAQNAEELFRKAKANPESSSQAKKDFAEAAARYRHLREECGSRSVGLFHNLGSCYLLADAVPEAILAYRQGLRLDPNNARLRAGLEYARAQVTYPPSGRGQPESEAWSVWLPRPSPFQAFLAVLLFLSGACIFLTHWLMHRRSVQLGRAVVMFALALGCGLLTAHLETQIQYEDDHPLIVVAADQVPFLKGNGPGYPRHADLPTLARGMEGRLLLRRGEWLQVRFASGDIGWVPRAEVIVES